MRQVKKILLVVLLLNLLAFAASWDAAARLKVPLTDAETDQLREVALEPGKRLTPVCP
jgi:hypothetical protein